MILFGAILPVTQVLLEAGQEDLSIGDDDQPERDGAYCFFFGGIYVLEAWLVFLLGVLFKKQRVLS